jgi:hypothetical protein
MTTVERSLEHQNSLIATVCNILVLTSGSTVVYSAAGYLSGRLFHIVNPVGGSVFGAIFAITTMTSEIAFGCILKHFNIQNQTIKDICSCGSIAIGTIAGIAATTAAGFALTPVNGVLLGVAVIATQLFALIVLKLIDNGLKALSEYLLGPTAFNSI